MAYQIRIKAIPLKSLASTSFGASYTLVTASSGIPNPCLMLKIVNNSDEDVTVSYDGTTDQDFVPKGTVAELKPGDVNSPNNYSAIWAQGTQVWVKGSTGMTGSVYVSGYYISTAN